MSLRRPCFAVFLFLLSQLAAAALPAQKHVQGEFSFATGPEPDFVAVHEVASAWPTQPGPASDPRWRNWMVDSQVDQRPHHAVAYHDLAQEATVSEMVGDAGKVSLEFNPLYQKLTIHRVELRRAGVWSNRFDASRVSLAKRESGFENNLSDGRVTAMVLLADVRPGDVVRVAWSIDGKNPIIADSDEDTFRLAWMDPTLDRYVRVLYGPQVKVDLRRFNTDLAVGNSIVGDHREISGHAHLVKSILDEGDYPNWYDGYPSLQVAAARSWADVVAWARPLYPSPAQLPAELESRLATWSAIADPHARAFAVLRAVQAEVRYFGAELGDNTHRPTPPAETWQRRYGDCKDKAYLTVELLRRLGIEAEPALVSTLQGRALLERLPAASLFNHVIVRARIAGQSYWLDPTLSEQHGDLRTLDVRDYGVALPIRAEETALVPVNAPAQASNAIEVEESFEPSATDDSMQLGVTSTYTGLRAEQMRWRLSSEGVEPVSRGFADYYRKRYSELSVASPLAVEETADGRLVLREHYLIKDGWVTKLGTHRQLELYADALVGDSRMPTTLERVGPLALNRPSVLRHLITVHLPQGWSMGGLPAATKVNASELAYERKSSATDSSFTIQHRLDILADHVPAAHVPAFLRALREVDDDIGVRVSLSEAQDHSDADRQQRLRKLLRDAAETNGDAK